MSFWKLVLYVGEDKYISYFEDFDDLAVYISDIDRNKVLMLITNVFIEEVKK